jgi:hypothetical protein
VTEREVSKALDAIACQPPTKEDWLDLYTTIEAYKQRCLVRGILRAANSAELLRHIQKLAAADAPEVEKENS